MVKHYPLLFAPIYKEMLWGGDRLSTVYNRQLPYKKTGESWDISCRPDEMGIIENGPSAGMSFEEYIAYDREGVLGTRLANQERFPLLVKLIDANDTLSVQVHPDDADIVMTNKDRINNVCPVIPGLTSAKDTWNPQDTGKNEMWYILIPPTDGNLIIGLKPGITPHTLRQAYKNGTVEDCLNRLPVKAGDIVNIPAGLIHALTPGVMVAEVQQNSDITYRLYDYNRVGLDGKPRQLHVDDAIAVTDFEGKIPQTTVPGLAIKKDDSNLIYTIANPYFAVIKYELGEALTESSNPEAFSIFTCVEGEAVISQDDCVRLPLGRSVLIPAGLGDYTLRSKGDKKCVLLKSFVPNIEKDFLAPLRQYGYTHESITQNTAVYNNIFCQEQ